MLLKTIYTLFIILLVLLVAHHGINLLIDYSEYKAYTNSDAIATLKEQECLK